MTNNPHKTLKHHKQQIKIFQSLQPPKKVTPNPRKHHQPTDGDTQTRINI